AAPNAFTQATCRSAPGFQKVRKTPGAVKTARSFCHSKRSSACTSNTSSRPPGATSAAPPKSLASRGRRFTASCGSISPMHRAESLHQSSLRNDQKINTPPDDRLKSEHPRKIPQPRTCAHTHHSISLTQRVTHSTLRLPATRSDAEQRLLFIHRNSFAGEFTEVCLRQTITCHHHHKVRRARMKIRTAAAFCLALCLSAFFSVSVSAQSQTTGRIAGTVKDEKGDVIAGAEITVTGKATGEERQVTADAEGNYTVLLLTPGAWQVTIKANGFKRAFFDIVRVVITETTVVNASLVVGAVTEESLTITSASPLVQTEGAQLGRVVDSRAVAELPLATRNFTQILGLSPGAATYLPDNTAVGRNSQNISVNGARVTNNNFQINGVDANSMGTNSAPSLSVPAPETIQEFKVQTSLYDATFGRSGGGTVQAVTKSGTSEFHGAVYEYLRNKALNANNPFLKAAGVAQPELTRNVFGGTIGGPGIPDKLFFFISYQGTRENNGASPINSLTSNVLVAPGLTDDRSQATLLKTFFPGSTTVTSINPTALSLLNAKLGNGQYLIATPQASGRYSGSAISKFQEDQFNSNFDWRLSDKDSIAFKFFFSNAPQTLVLPSFLGGGPNVPGFGNFQKNNNRLATVQHTHVFSPNLINEARVGYNFIRVDAFPQEPINDADIGIRRANAGDFPGLPLMRIAPAAGGVVIGTSPTIDVKAVAPSTTLADTLSISKGKHFIRAGAEFRYNENNYVLNFF